MFLIIMSSLMFAGSILAQENNKTVTVNILGLDSDKGKVIVSLYKSAESFPKKPTIRKTALIKKNTASVSFENIEAGTYAIMCFHDENENKKLDFSAFGRPKERIAASNNAKGRFGPPKFKDAKFLVQDKITIHNIEM
ncbi:DUF2141 domain-containing protein [Ancylomarina sp. DW003]|nr:DUF2141 domain-containing protein [Ancylomarina sp. DW003]MDE5423542.1 DUF2141 domain-containing protein [Ancylomarina sp. DW003]